MYLILVLSNRIVFSIENGRIGIADQYILVYIHIADQYKRKPKLLVSNLCKLIHYIKLVWPVYNNLL